MALLVLDECHTIVDWQDWYSGMEYFPHVVNVFASATKLLLSGTVSNETLSEVSDKVCINIPPENVFRSCQDLPAVSIAVRDRASLSADLTTPILEAFGNTREQLVIMCHTMDVR